MPISGLVISMVNQPQSQRDTIQSIASDSRIEIGVVESGRVAIVSETESSQEDKALWQWLQELPGVVHIDLAFASVEDPNHVDAPGEADVSHPVDARGVKHRYAAASDVDVSPSLSPEGLK